MFPGLVSDIALHLLADAMPLMVHRRTTGFDAYHDFVDPAWAAPSDPNHDTYVYEPQCGFQVGHNIVVCPDSLPGGSKGFQALSGYEPAGGQNLECAKSTWGAMMVHELSHIFGTRDGGIHYAYGFQPATQIATDAGNGQGNGGITPLTFADTFSLFALGEYLASVFSTRV